MKGDQGGLPPKPEEEEAPTERRALYQRLESHFWRRIFAGLLALIPLLITILIIRAVFTFIDNIFRGDDGLLTPIMKYIPFDFPGIGVIVTVVLLYTVGALYASRIGQMVMGLQKAVLTRIPIARRIYTVAQQAADSLSSGSQHQFSRVVFLEWPRPGVLAMGFVTARCVNPKDPDSEVLAIYIPTIPNPTSGMLAFARDDEVTDSNLSVEDAMKVVFSGGIVMPEVLQAVQPEALTGERKEGKRGPT